MSGSPMSAVILELHEQGMSPKQIQLALWERGMLGRGGKLVGVEVIENFLRMERIERAGGVERRFRSSEAVRGELERLHQKEKTARGAETRHPQRA